MGQFLRVTVAFLSREEGPTAVEYAVMLALIITVCVTAISSLGSNANKSFTTASTQLASAGR